MRWLIGSPTIEEGENKPFSSFSLFWGKRCVCVPLISAFRNSQIRSWRGGEWQSPFTWGNSESQSQFSFFGGGGKRECVETTRKANLKVQKGGGERRKQTASVFVCVTEPAENGRNKPKAV